jgi:hypothetical protein
VSRPLGTIDDYALNLTIGGYSAVLKHYGYFDVSARNIGNGMRLIVAIATFVTLTICPSLAHAESVYVKYRGEVDLKYFDCNEITRSSFIERVCYDPQNEYMLISLNGTFYHYCEIDDGTVSSLLDAPSMGRFYNANIKGNFDCRVNRVPEYDDDDDSDH